MVIIANNNITHKERFLKIILRLLFDRKKDGRIKTKTATM